MTTQEYILHQFGEMKREMLVATEGLSEADMTSHEPGGHVPVAWIPAHCTGLVHHRPAADRREVSHARDLAGVGASIRLPGHRAAGV